MWNNSLFYKINWIKNENNWIQVENDKNTSFYLIMVDKKKIIEKLIEKKFGFFNMIYVLNN